MISQISSHEFPLVPFMQTVVGRSGTEFCYANSIALAKQICEALNAQETQRLAESKSWVCQYTIPISELKESVIKIEVI